MLLRSIAGVRVVRRRTGSGRVADGGYRAGADLTALLGERQEAIRLLERLVSEVASMDEVRDFVVRVRAEHGDRVY